MLIKIKQFFSTYLAIDENSSTVSPDQIIQLATAALLIEVTKADYELTKQESEAVIDALRQTYQLDAMALDSLLKLAEEEAHEASSLYQFTRLVNDFYNYDQKLQLIESMWQVAFADGDLDKYEEHLIRKVAELIYVSHKDFIRVKHTAIAVATG